MDDSYMHQKGDGYDRFCGIYVIIILPITFAYNVFICNIYYCMLIFAHHLNNQIYHDTIIDLFSKSLLQIYLVWLILDLSE